MTKSILLITFGLSTLFATNTVSPNISEKATEQRVEKRQHQTEKKHHRTERKHQRQKVDQGQYRIEKKDRQQKIENRKNRSEQRRYKAQRKQQQKMDRKLKKRDTVKRNFRTHNEFKRVKKQHRNGYHKMHHKPVKKYYNHRGYRHYRQAWYDDFYYDRASFYDRYGYYYGYFNRIGYFLEGIFYRYDRYYTFRDRVRGKGIFDHRYYRPYTHNDYYDYDDPYYRR